jgi:hypothetical protein
VESVILQEQPHLGMLVLAGKPKACQHVVDANQNQIDAFDRSDFVSLVDHIGGFELHNHHSGIVDRRIGFRNRE